MRPETPWVPLWTPRRISSLLRCLRSGPHPALPCLKLVTLCRALSHPRPFRPSADLAAHAATAGGTPPCPPLPTPARGPPPPTPGPDSGAPAGPSPATPHRTNGAGTVRRGALCSHPAGPAAGSCAGAPPSGCSARGGGRAAGGPGVAAPTEPASSARPPPTTGGKSEAGSGGRPGGDRRASQRPPRRGQRLSPRFPCTSVTTLVALNQERSREQQ